VLCAALLAVAVPAEAVPVTSATPSQRVVISWDGTTEILDIEPDPTVESMSLIIPTPTKPEVTPSDPALFAALASMIAPVQTVEDDWWGRTQADLGEPEAEALGAVTDVESTVIKASSTKKLAAWLKDNDLELTDAATADIAQYASDGWSFTLVTLAADGATAPLRLTFETTAPVFPIRLAASNETPTSFRVFVLGDARSDFRQWPRTRREINAARDIVWAGPVTGPLAPRGTYLTVTDLRLDDPAAQARADVAIVDAPANVDLIPEVVVYRRIELLGFPLGWLIVVWGGIGVIVGGGYLANRFRAK
jgi:hypothetical protein